MDNFDHVVFIDDDYATNYYHKIVVTDSGVVRNQQYFSSTIEALNYFKNLTPAEKIQLPEVIFLDINLPEMTGWEFLEEFKHLDLSPKPKVIMLSTSMNPLDRIKANENPIVVELIDKPLTVDYMNKLRSKLELCN